MAPFSWKGCAGERDLRGPAAIDGRIPAAIGEDPRYVDALGGSQRLARYFTAKDERRGRNLRAGVLIGPELPTSDDSSGRVDHHHHQPPIDGRQDIVAPHHLRTVVVGGNHDVASANLLCN